MTNDCSSVNENVQPMMNINVVLWHIESLASKLCSNKSEVYSLIQHYNTPCFIILFQKIDNYFYHECVSNELVICSATRIVCNKSAGGVTDKYCKKQKHQDKEKTHFGKQLLDPCVVEGIHIGNGKVNSDLLGHFTLISNRCCSTIDHCIADTAMFKYISIFKVMDFDISLNLPKLCTLSVVKQSIKVMEFDVQLEHLEKIMRHIIMSKSVEFSQNMCNSDVISEIQCINESGKLSTEETVNYVVFWRDTVRYGSKISPKKANTETISQK